MIIDHSDANPFYTFLSYRTCTNLQVTAHAKFRVKHFDLFSSEKIKFFSRTGASTNLRLFRKVNPAYRNCNEKYCTLLSELTKECWVVIQSRKKRDSSQICKIQAFSLIQEGYTTPKIYRCILSCDFSSYQPR